MIFFILQKKMQDTKPHPPFKEQLPNATLILILGIISILTSFIYGIVGLICGIIALILSRQARALYAQSPERYTQDSYNQLEIGRICAIIGIIVSLLFLIYITFMVILFGKFLSFLFEILKSTQ